MTERPLASEYADPDYAVKYLAKMLDLPHRVEGEATLLAELPVTSQRVLDLGCGDGHLLALTLTHCPDASGLGLDVSPPMLAAARRRFARDARVQLIAHDLEDPLPDLGTFDVVVSSFAIHHCCDLRKRMLYAEVFAMLQWGGVFCNLEHVASPSEPVHQRFLQAMQMTAADEDPSNKLLDVKTQLQWLRELGFVDVDCHWKWRELALLAGRKPADPEPGRPRQ